jgi:rsbT antagonist protein RsbS
MPPTQEEKAMVLPEAANIQKLDNLLLVTVPRDMLDDDVLSLRRHVARSLRSWRTPWVLLDFAAVDICDSFFGRFIQSMAHMAKLMGAEVILSGLQDAVVETLVDLGLPMHGIYAVLDLDDAMELSRTKSRPLLSDEDLTEVVEEEEAGEAIPDAADAGIAEKL